MKLALAIGTLYAVMQAVLVVMEHHDHWTRWLISGALVYIWWRSLPFPDDLRDDVIR